MTSKNARHVASEEVVGCNKANASAAGSAEMEGLVHAWPASQPGVRKVSELIPFARNARTHSDEQIDQVVRSIAQFGWTNPILIRAETGGVLAGHGRLLAAERMGIETVPVLQATGWTEEQARLYVIADNKLALNAGWDEQLLALELSELAELGADLDLTGFSEGELLGLDADRKQYLTDPDDMPAMPEDVVSRAGDVWILGAHRVICGDSTSQIDIGRLMGAEKADACWTDPPYNVNYQGAAGKIQNDNMGTVAFAGFLQNAFNIAFSALKPGGAIYVAHADTEGLAFRTAFQSVGFKLSGCLVWAKDALVLGRSDYQWQHEPILYGWKPGAAHNWYGGRKQTTVVSLEGSVFTLNDDGTLTVRVGQESLIVRGTGFTVQPVEPTILQVSKPKRSADHPTMKPVELISRMLKNSTEVGDIVLDLFGGSGSTLISCEMLSRAARLCELDPRFVDVIVRRWQEFAGAASVLEADGSTFDQCANRHLHERKSDGSPS